MPIKKATTAKKTTSKKTTTAKKVAAPKEETVHKITPEELLPDGTLLCKFVIDGRPATKKTHQQVIWVKGHPRVIPSKQYSAYEKICKDACEDAWIKTGKQPMDFGVGIHCRIYLDTWAVGDHVGYLQAIGDILEKYKVIANDKYIHWTDDGKHWLGGVDKVNPRVEISITRFRHPYEDYREKKEAAIAKKLAKKQ